MKSMTRAEHLASTRTALTQQKRFCQIAHNIQDFNGASQHEYQCRCLEKRIRRLEARDANEAYQRSRMQLTVAILTAALAPR